MGVIDLGNCLSFEDYYMKYYPQVYRYIYKKIKNVQLSEDIAMDSFAVCWEKFKTFDSEKASFQTWLYVIVNNKLKNYYRDKKDFAELDDNILDTLEGTDELEKAVELTFLREHLADALEELNEIQREIIIYKYFYDKKSNEIALMMGLTPVNVRVQSKRGLEKMKEYFIKNNIRWE